MDASPEVSGHSSWLDAMKRGDFALAWRIADASMATRAGQPCCHWPRHQQYVWDGTPLDGKRVLVRCYHGLGDTVQFIRFTALLKTRASEVIVWAQPALLRLLETAGGIDHLLPLHDGVPDVAYDVDVEIMELAHVFRVEPQTLPQNVPYLYAPPLDFALEASCLNVGIVWEAGNWDPRRSIPVGELAPLTEIPFIRLYAMQHGPGRTAWPLQWGRICPAKNAWETARWMQTLDLIISVDSFPAHLAGALGRPVWTLLPHEADWRWMESREDCPWYPTMTLFLQRRAGAWAEVIARVGTQLRQLAIKPPAIQNKRVTDGARGHQAACL
jgi:hypothetical protein